MVIARAARRLLLKRAFPSSISILDENGELRSRRRAKTLWNIVWDMNVPQYSSRQPAEVSWAMTLRRKVRIVLNRSMKLLSLAGDVGGMKKANAWRWT
jgi:hypothetical protein